jgi:hypothetical protein
MDNSRLATYLVPHPEYGYVWVAMDRLDRFHRIIRVSIDRIWEIEQQNVLELVFLEKSPYSEQQILVEFVKHLCLNLKHSGHPC